MAGNEPRPFFDFLEGCLRHKVILADRYTVGQCSTCQSESSQPVSAACTKVYCLPVNADCVATWALCSILLGYLEAVIRATAQHTC